jgi:hypothetical protein
MATAALVDRSIDLGRKIIAVLSRAGIPVTVGLWAYASDAEEWRLMIATPLVDDIGPLAAYKKVQKAVEKAGIESEFPLRRIFLKSPKDRTLRLLDHESRSLGREDYHSVNAPIEGSFVEDAYVYSGSLDILRVEPGRGKSIPLYQVMYFPYSEKGGSVKTVSLQGEEALREFVEQRVGIRREVVRRVLRELAEGALPTIPNVQLKRSELKRLDLA